MSCINESYECDACGSSGIVQHDYEVSINFCPVCGEALIGTDRWSNDPDGDE